MGKLQFFIIRGGSAAQAQARGGTRLQVQGNPNVEEDAVFGGFEFLFILLNLLIPALMIAAGIFVLIMLVRFFTIATEMLRTLQRIEEELRRRP